MDLSVKKSGSCTCDQLSLGEVMLRLDSGESRVRCARQFNVNENGGEYNVARGNRKCFQLKTALAENDFGYLIEDLIMQSGVDTSFIKWIPYDGIVRKVRNGLNFTERGFDARDALGVSDWSNTAVNQIKPGDIDWEYIFGVLGVRWVHTGGIYSALSLSSSQVEIEAIKTAKKQSTIDSYDLSKFENDLHCYLDTQEQLGFLMELRSVSINIDFHAERQTLVKWAESLRCDSPC